MEIGVERGSENYASHSGRWIVRLHYIVTPENLLIHKVSNCCLAIGRFREKLYGVKYSGRYGSLPKTLDKFYERILLDIEQEDQQLGVTFRWRSLRKQ